MLMVGARGFEPPTSRSRTERSTRLSHAPTKKIHDRCACGWCQLGIRLLALNFVLATLCDKVMERPRQKVLRETIGVLFILYGCLHLAVLAFGWSIILAISIEGYFNVLKQLALLALTICTVVMPTLTGYAFLRNRRWQGPAVYLTSVVILIVSFMVLWQIFSVSTSPARVVFGILYGGLSVAIAVGGILCNRQTRV